MYTETAPFTLVDQMFGVSSTKLYNQFLTQIVKRKIPFQTTPYGHNHYLQVLRECVDHFECTQILFVACKNVCLEHTQYPVNKNQLTEILSSLL